MERQRQVIREGRGQEMERQRQVIREGRGQETGRQSAGLSACWRTLSVPPASAAVTLLISVSVSVYETDCCVLGFNIIKLIFTSRTNTIVSPLLFSSVPCLFSLRLSRSVPWYLCNSAEPTNLVMSQVKVLQHGGALSCER